VHSVGMWHACIFLVCVSSFPCRSYVICSSCKSSCYTRCLVLSLQSSCIECRTTKLCHTRCFHKTTNFCCISHFRGKLLKLIKKLTECNWVYSHIIYLKAVDFLHKLSVISKPLWRHDHFTSSTILRRNFNIFYAFLFQQLLQEL